MAKTPTKQAAKAPPTLKNTNANYVYFAEAAVGHLECPITQSLCVCPALAEDGEIYEKSAIERWLSLKETSPTTNLPMGTRLVFSRLTRALIDEAIENGVVDDDAAAAWHLQSAKAIASGKLAGAAASSVKDHLERAEALCSSPEAELMLRAVALKSQMDALLKEEADAGFDAVSIAFGEDSFDRVVRMKEFLELRKYSKIRIIDDRREFERLCERPGPNGAIGCVGIFCGLLRQRIHRPIQLRTFPNLRY